MNDANTEQLKLRKNIKVCQPGGKEYLSKDWRMFRSPNCFCNPDVLVNITLRTIF